MLVYIKPLSTFPKLHSDTLFGAITSAVSELYPDLVDEMIGEFEDGKPPFLISSTFPVIFNGDEKVKFYPKIIMGSDLSGIDSNIIKDYKKVEYLEEKLFYGMINGEMSEPEILNNYDRYYRFSNLLMDEKLDADIGLGENILPNNSVNRLISDTKIFYSSGDSFKNMGLFFLVQINDEKYRDVLKSTILFLKDRGFGRDISTGKGHFDFDSSVCERFLEEFGIPIGLMSISKGQDESILVVLHPATVDDMVVQVAKDEFVDYQTYMGRRYGHE